MGAAAPNIVHGLGLNALLFRSQLQDTSDRIAVSWTGQQLTYADLQQRITRLSRQLRADGLQRGDRVCVLLANRPEWLEYFFAIIAAGGVVVPVNHYSSIDELAHILRDSAASWLIFEPRYSNLVTTCQAAAGVRQLIVDGVTAGRSAPVLTNDQTPTSPATSTERSLEDTVLLHYTSGTSGRAKAAVHSHTTVMWNALHQTSDLAIEATSVTLVVPSFCWSAGLHDLTLATLWQQGRLVLFPTGGLQTEALLATIERERVSHVFLAPSILRRLVTNAAGPIPDLSSLKVVLTGGEHLPPSLVAQLAERFGTLPLRPSYGLTEFPSTMLLMPPAQAYSRPGSVGVPTLISQVRIVDEQGRCVATGETGEIVCRSPATMRGYYHDADASARALRHGWLYTGDLGMVDADGFFYVVGRKKDMLISGGLNVYPAEVERALEECPAIAEAVVVAQPDPRWGEIPKAHVVLRPGRTLSRDELNRFLETRLAAYKVPKEYVFHDRPFPRSVSGKVVKAML